MKPIITAPLRFIGIGAGLAGLLGFPVLAFVGGGDPGKQSGRQEPPLRWGGLQGLAQRKP